MKRNVKICIQERMAKALLIKSPCSKWRGNANEMEIIVRLGFYNIIRTYLKNVGNQQVTLLNVVSLI